MRLVALVFIASCAADTSKLEARMHDLEKDVADIRATKPNVIAMSGACAIQHDVTVPSGTMFDASVPFDIGETHLTGGDRIVIQEVRGTSPSLAVNGLYVVRGEYTLASADEAEVSLTVTAHR